MATSMAWMISVNGFVVDARRVQREVQEETFRKGLIPYMPGEARRGTREVLKRDVCG
jgi:hypothetical protein